MRSPVQLYIRVRLEDGSYPYLKAVIQPNGHVRPGYALSAGRAVKVSNGTYHLRYQREGKRVWEPVSPEADVALISQRRKIRELEDAAAGLPSAQVQITGNLEPSTSKPSKRLLAECIAKYLAEVKEHRERKTFAAYSRSILSFAESTTKTHIEDLSREDALDWIATLRKRGNQPRTLSNRANNLDIFMRHFGLPGLLAKKDKPKFTQKQVRAYNEMELGMIFSHASEDEADLLYFLLCTGGRDQEASFVCWTDVDLVQKTYTVTEHLDLGYRPKDKEEGTLPIPDVLVDRLRERRKRHPRTRLIFETAKRKPDGHLLRVIKSIAFRAGVNCGECVNRKGQSCREHPVCKHILLHKMRKTFATNVHNAGMPAKTVQRYLRHSDLTSTLRYLADQPEEQVRATINTTFTCFSTAKHTEHAEV